MLRRTMVESFLTTHITRCRTAKDISNCIAEFARINIVLNYTNFVLNSPVCLLRMKTGC